MLSARSILALMLVAGIANRAPMLLAADRCGAGASAEQDTADIRSVRAQIANFTDWYFPSSGLSVTSASGVRSNAAGGTCTAGNIGASCDGVTDRVLDPDNPSQ